MDYFGIIKKAFKMNWKNKFLWIFGILIGSSAGFNSFNYNFDNAEIQKTWAEFTSQELTNFDINAFWASYGSLVIFLLILLMVLGIIFFVLNLTSQGALVGGVEKLEAGEDTNFSKSFKLGWKNFWRIWGLNITILLSILIVLSLWIIPTCLLVISGSYASAVVVGIILFFVNLFFWILMCFISPYALRIVVLKKLTIFQSLRQSLHFVRDNLAEVFVTYLLLAAVSFAVGIAVMIAVLLVGGVLALIGYGIFLASSAAAIIYGLTMGMALILAIIIFTGGYSSFHSTVLTLTYLKLIDRS